MTAIITNPVKGSHFESRKIMQEAGLHNHNQRGIARSANESGYMSIVLSGGYSDDEDFGTEIIYTGEGKRDNKGNIIADQTITGGNKRLVESFERGEPIYVFRGHKHRSPFSPKSGYSFAGEFLITEHWIEKGQDNFDIIRFKLHEIGTTSDSLSNALYEDESPSERREYKVNRIIRETKIAQGVKHLYSYACQVCDRTISLPTGGEYAEAAHIKPLGLPHNGPDTLENLLCLCPNHHLMFDKYCFSIDPETFKLIGLNGSLTVHESHQLSRSALEYHHHNYVSHSNID